MRVVPLESPLKGHQLLYFFFKFQYWIFETMSKFWAASCKIEPNLLLVWITGCIESCFPIGWRTVIWWKNPPKCTSSLVWIAEWWNFLPAMRSTIQRTIDGYSAFMIYGVRFGRKDRVLSTCKPWSEQPGGLDSILHEAAQDFEVF